MRDAARPCWLLTLCFAGSTSAIASPISPRSGEAGGYTAPPELRTWQPFTYAPPAVRRKVVRDYVKRQSLTLPVLPPLRVLLIGGVASGKGTLAPMISHAFSCRVVGIGQLLRGETRAGTRRGLEVADLMAAGALLDDRLVLKILNDRLAGAPDSARSGWLLDGFPRTQEQVEASLNSPECPLLPPVATECHWWALAGGGDPESRVVGAQTGRGGAS